MAFRFFKKRFADKKPVKANAKSIFAWQKILITVTIVTILVIEAFLLGVVKKNCDTEECFTNALQRCGTAKYLKLENYNYYRWVIDGKDDGKCDVNVQLIKMASGTPVDKVLLFEGKEMSCKIPLDILENTENVKVENILNYCTGPLKEAIYQSIIERLYTVIVYNLGSAIKELDRTIKTGAL